MQLYRQIDRVVEDPIGDFLLVRLSAPRALVKSHSQRLFSQPSAKFADERSSEIRAGRRRKNERLSSATRRRSPWNSPLRSDVEDRRTETPKESSEQNNKDVVPFVGSSSSSMTKAMFIQRFSTSFKLDPLVEHLHRFALSSFLCATSTRTRLGRSDGKDH